MVSNIEKYKKDLEALILFGEKLLLSFQFEIYPDYKEAFVKGKDGKKDKKLTESVKKLPSFNNDYQKWYSESLQLIVLLLPDRSDDFISLYKKSKTKRKDITFENYVIEDALIGLQVTRTGFGEKEIIADKSAALPKFQQQLNILKSVEKRFESSLFDIEQLVQADLFDSELDSARELNKNKFIRAAGAVAGVVLEKHLIQVCDNHKIKITKTNSSINDLNDLLKNNSILDTKDWRFIQHLGDIRNLCDHEKKKEPTKDDVEDLISGVDKITKTIF